METGGSEYAHNRALRRTRGGVLAEFALLGFLVWFLLAGILEIGRALTAQQLLQHAARTMAREMARIPLPASATFSEAAINDAFRQNVFDDRFLVIDSELLTRCNRVGFDEPGHPADLDAFFQERPIGNRLLRPLMISDRRGSLPMIRYPGTLLFRNDRPTGCQDGSHFKVGIAEVDSANGSVRWHPVVEEHDGLEGADTFSLSSGGWANLRVNYPFQSAALLAAQGSGRTDPATGDETQLFVSADQSISASNSVPVLNATLAPSNEEGGVYAGRLGLGRLFAASDATGRARALRPYRRLLRANAGFRREIFGGP